MEAFANDDSDGFSDFETNTETQSNDASKNSNTDDVMLEEADDVMEDEESLFEVHAFPFFSEFDL